MDAIFDAVGKDAVQADPGFQAWLKSSESWVHTYAAFKVQLSREKAFNNKWHDCTQWSKGQSEVQSIVNPAGQDYDQVLRVYFMQYHLHLQLLEASKVPHHVHNPQHFQSLDLTYCHEFCPGAMMHTYAVTFSRVVSFLEYCYEPDAWYPSLNIAMSLTQPTHLVGSMRNTRGSLSRVTSP
jgi:hypothetical protein